MAWNYYAVTYDFGQRQIAQPGPPAVFVHRCGLRGCGLQGDFVCWFPYKMRAGGQATSHKRMCRDHASRFAAKHGLSMPSEPGS